LALTRRPDRRGADLRLGLSRRRARGYPAPMDPILLGLTPGPTVPHAPEVLTARGDVLAAPVTTAEPAMRTRRLLDDGGLVLLDVRCSEHPPAVGREERAGSLEVVLPMTGLFVREVSRVGGRSRPAAEIGDTTRALFFRAGEPYRVRHPLGGADRSLAIAIQPAAAGWLHRSPTSLPPSRPISARTHLFARRLAAGLAGGHLDPLSGAEIAVLLLDRLIRQDPGDVDPGRHGHDRGGIRALVDEVRLVLAGRLGERLTLIEIGRLVGSSPFHLARAFRATTGLSIHTYRTQLRVRGVLARLEAGDRDLAGIALDLGFSDHSHMANVVRREIGRPPSALRRPPTERELDEMRTILQA
jgi:AraC-like DNA-binding protein